MAQALAVVAGLVIGGAAGAIGALAGSKRKKNSPTAPSIIATRDRGRRTAAESRTVGAPTSTQAQRTAPIVTGGASITGSSPVGKVA